VENRRSCAQKLAAVERWLAGREMALSRQGYVVESWRQYRGRRLGPYYRLRYRERGRMRSVYLGRDAVLAEEVRGRLSELQRPLRRKREAHKRWKKERAYLRILKARWEAELRKIGLRLKGFEVRGPVTFCLRRAFFIELMQQDPAPAERAGRDKAAFAADGPPTPTRQAKRWAGARCASLSHPTSALSRPTLGCTVLRASGPCGLICGKSAFWCPKIARSRRLAVHDGRRRQRITPAHTGCVRVMPEAWRLPRAPPRGAVGKIPIMRVATFLPFCARRPRRVH
jgi:hypothetical protein